MNPSFPSNPIAAAMHPDPYPYYAQLVEAKPLYRDHALDLWVASSADAVTVVLTSELCRVRPVDEAVPKIIVGTVAGDIFRQLIRMNDGPGHCPFDRAVAVTLASLEPTRIEECGRRIANRLLERIDPKDLSTVSRFTFDLSSHIIGTLLGFPESELDKVSAWIGEFVRCVFGSTNLEEIERGKVAATHLWRLAADLLKDSYREGVLQTLAREATRVGRDDQGPIIANGIGFLSQAYEATAGLISNSLLALATQKNVRSEVAADPLLVGNFVLEVLRHNPPNHSTRRFVCADGVVGQQKMNTGDIIVVLLAAANRDPQANADPHRFNPHRDDRKLFTFGTGMHACPGDALGLQVVQIGLQALLSSGIEIDRLRDNLTYRVSPNTHIPLFAGRA